MPTTAHQSAYTGTQIDDAVAAVQTAAFIDTDDGTGGLVETATALSDLTDVSISSPSNNQGLIYDSTAGKWMNKAIPGGGGGGGEENVIEIVKVNGSALTPDANKAVDITAVTTFNGSSGAITYTAPVTSVNGNTGAVTIATGDTNVIESVSFNGTAATITNKNAAITASIPDESTVSGWGFTKNVGTVTGVKINGTTKNPTSGVVDIGTVITSETSLSKGTTTGSGNAVTDLSVSGHTITLTKGKTFLESESDPIFAASAAYGISSSDITNWNGKTSNTGTITSVKMNGSTVASSGEADLGTVLTSHQSIKTLNSTSLVGTGNITINGLPSVSSSDNGKVLEVSSGSWTAVKPVTIYSGSSAPSSGTGSNGDIYIQTS